MKFSQLIIVLLVSVVSVAVAFAQQSEKKISSDYKSVEAAFNALESNPDAQLTEYEGWAIFKLKGGGKYELWSFTPPEHPANPTVIRREIVKRGDEILISMDAFCESNMFDCDDLIEQFKEINENIRNKAKAESE